MEFYYFPRVRKSKVLWALNSTFCWVRKFGGDKRNVLRLRNLHHFSRDDIVKCMSTLPNEAWFSGDIMPVCFTELQLHLISCLSGVWHQRPRRSLSRSKFIRVHRCVTYLWFTSGFDLKVEAWTMRFKSKAFRRFNACMSAECQGGR